MMGGVVSGEVVVDLARTKGEGVVKRRGVMGVADGQRRGIRARRWTAERTMVKYAVREED